MSNCLYITATEAQSGKSAVALGVMEMLHRRIGRVGFFRPIINVADENERDNDIELISSYFNLDIPYEKMYGYKMSEVTELAAQDREDEIIDGILSRYNELKESCDFILVEGTDFSEATAAIELVVNAAIINNLGCPVLTVANAFGKDTDEIIQSINILTDSFTDRGCRVVGTIINRTGKGVGRKVIAALKSKKQFKDQLLYSIPDDEILGNPTVKEVAENLNAGILCGKEQLNRNVRSFTVAAMHLRHFLPRIKPGTLIITPGDRADIIIASLGVVASNTMNNISGIVLTGGLKPDPSVMKLVKGFALMVPIISVKGDTFITASDVQKIHAKLSADNERKIHRALGLFDKHVNAPKLGDIVVKTKTTIVTPKMFEFRILQQARQNRKHIVLPEGEEERILKATEILYRRNVVDITLLGDEKRVREKISILGLKMDSINIIEPEKSDYLDDFVKTYYEIRKHKGITMEHAYDTMCDVSYFGTMMVRKGIADGMVSGSVHSTAATIKPAFEIIKTKPGFSIVSSSFFMCLRDKVLVYGDCAINPDPNAAQLAEIAISSALTAKTFGVEPLVAMLSYSTGESGKGADVDKVREATKIAKEKAQNEFPGLKIEGPIQYDAAVDAAVAKTKLPKSDVAGKATVFIFPDLNTGNNTYKAVQRSAGAIAVGPVLQGLNHPVNDLSRGCLVTDIVNTVALTAIQAQME
jgi:phosphate acetyltransferase